MSREKSCLYKEDLYRVDRKQATSSSLFSPAIFTRSNFTLGIILVELLSPSSQVVHTAGPPASTPYREILCCMERAWACRGEDCHRRCRPSRFECLPSNQVSQVLLPSSSLTFLLHSYSALPRRDSTWPLRATVYKGCAAHPWGPTKHSTECARHAHVVPEAIQEIPSFKTPMSAH